MLNFTCKGQILLSEVLPWSQFHLIWSALGLCSTCYFLPQTFSPLPLVPSSICLQNWSYFPFSLNYSCPQRWKPGFNSSTTLLSLPTAPCNFASRKVISQMLSVTPDNRVVASAILSECIFSELSKETRLTDHLCFCASIYVYWLNINFIKVLHALRDI